MKATRLIIAAGLLFATTVIALAQQKPAQKPPQKPSDLLSLFFHNHLDRILSPIGQPRPGPLPRARVTELREQFANQESKAPEAQKPIESLQGSAAVHGSSDLGAHRIDHPTWRDLDREQQEEQNRKQEAHQND